MSRIWNPFSWLHLTKAGGSGATPSPSPGIAPSAPAVPATASFQGAGALAAQAEDTFKQLSGDVARNRLRAGDATLLASGTERLGLIGEAEAIRAARTAEALPGRDRATFQGLIDQAASPTAQVFLYKALGSGHSVAEVAAFAQAIAGMDDSTLVHTLSLADDAAGDDHIQDGVVQQFEDACAPTTAQALRAEFDPIYALQVRQQNGDIHGFTQDPLHDRPALAAEQKHLLEDVGGGQAVARGQHGRGMMLPPAVNAMSAYTGFTYAGVGVSPINAANADGLLDKVAAQLQQGIPTPLRVTNATNSGGHFILCSAVEGSGASQRFLIHDPWSGTTGWITRNQFDTGNFTIAGWDRLSHAYLATPAPLGTERPSPMPAPAA